MTTLTVLHVFSVSLVLSPFFFCAAECRICCGVLMPRSGAHLGQGRANVWLKWSGQLIAKKKTTSIWQMFHQWTDDTVCVLLLSCVFDTKHCFSSLVQNGFGVGAQLRLSTPTHSFKRRLFKTNLDVVKCRKCCRFKAGSGFRDLLLTHHFVLFPRAIMLSLENLRKKWPRFHFFPCTN